MGGCGEYAGGQSWSTLAVMRTRVRAFVTWLKEIMGEGWGWRGGSWCGSDYLPVTMTMQLCVMYWLGTT